MVKVGVPKSWEQIIQSLDHFCIIFLLKHIETHGDLGFHLKKPIWKREHFQFEKRSSSASDAERVQPEVVLGSSWNMFAAGYLCIIPKQWRAKSEIDLQRTLNSQSNCGSHSMVSTDIDSMLHSGFSDFAGICCNTHAETFVQTFQNGATFHCLRHSIIPNKLRWILEKW